MPPMKKLKNEAGDITGGLINKQVIRQIGNQMMPDIRNNNSFQNLGGTNIEDVITKPSE